MIRAIGFDLDNTLYVETPAMRSLIVDYLAAKVAGELGRDKDEVAFEYRSLFDRLQSGRKALAELGIPDGRSYVQEALENAAVADVLDRDEGLVALMADLSDRYDLFLITGSKESIALDKLQALGVDPDTFAVRLYADTLPQVFREDGSAFRLVCGKLGYSLEELAFVGDRERVDILPAKSFGITTAIVNNSSSHADYELSSLDDLRTYFL